MMDKKWYAIYTRARTEKKVAVELTGHHIETYVPLLKTLKQWSDRKKWVEEPLIRSYVFVKIPEKEYLKVLKIAGVVSFVKFEGRIVPIPDWQIDNLRILLHSGEVFSHETGQFKKGDLVKITAGPLKDLTGEVIHLKGKRKLMIRLDVLDQNYSVDIHTALLEPVIMPAEK